MQCVYFKTGYMRGAYSFFLSLPFESHDIVCVFNIKFNF